MNYLRFAFLLLTTIILYSCQRTLFVPHLRNGATFFPKVVQKQHFKSCKQFEQVDTGKVLRSEFYFNPKGLVDSVTMLVKDIEPFQPYYLTKYYIYDAKDLILEQYEIIRLKNDTLQRRDTTLVYCYDNVANKGYEYLNHYGDVVGYVEYYHKKGGVFVSKVKEYSKNGELLEWIDFKGGLRQQEFSGFSVDSTLLYSGRRANLKTGVVRTIEVVDTTGKIDNSIKREFNKQGVMKLEIMQGYVSPWKKICKYEIDSRGLITSSTEDVNGDKKRYVYEYFK